MPVADDWQFDFAAQRMFHIDGRLSYDTNTGTAPALGDYVIGTTSGAVGRVIAGSDLGGVAAAGTLDLSAVVGIFEDNEPIRVLSQVPFDTVANGGFVVGDTITGPVAETIDVQAIDYNFDTAVDGEGIIHGDNLTGVFANNEQLDVSGGATAVGLVNGTETDNSALFATALVNGTLAVPGTANTNNSVIIHYDAGTIDIPRQATVADAVTGAVGTVQQVVGVTATGSLRLIDSNTTGGAWTNNNALNLNDVVFFNAVVAGEVFQVGDLVEGQTSLARFFVVAVIDDLDGTGKLITARKSGVVTLNEDLNRILPGNVLGPKIAQAENTTNILAAATLNLPGGVRTEQRADQGGIYAPATSLNVRRRSNDFYSLAQDTFDELGQLDDLPPIRGNVRASLYTVLAPWKMHPASFRFLEFGQWQDSALNNVYTNYLSDILSPDINADGFLQTTANPTPPPDPYIERNGIVLPQFWLEGNVNTLIPVRTNQEPRFIDGAVPGLGQSIDNEAVTWFVRDLRRQYDNRTIIGRGTPTVSLNAPADPDNLRGTHTMAWDTGSAATLLVGEEIRATTAGVLKRGIVTAQTGDAGATGTVEYVLKSATQFANNDAVTAGVSGKTLNVNEPGGFLPANDVVAGFGVNIRTMTVDRRFTGGTTTGTFTVGEVVTQTGSGATGFLLEDDAGTLYVQDATGTFNGTGLLTGGTSGATNTPLATADFTTVPKDIGDGAGDQDYSAVTTADITGGAPQAILDVYEWDKYLTRKEADANELLQGGPGLPAGVEGRIYRFLDATFAEVPAAPYGTFSGGVMSGARSHYIEKFSLVAADLQNISLIDFNGVPRNPPNLQSLVVANLLANYAVAAYRSTGVGNEDILRNEFSVGTVGGGNNQAADSTILLAAGTRTVSPTPVDVPDAGVLYIEDPDPANPGIFLQFPYSAVNRTTNVYTLASGTIGAVTGALDLVAADDSHVVFITDNSIGASLSNTIQFLATIDLFIVARLKGFEPFQAAAQFIATGVNVNIVRRADEVVDLP